MRPNKRVAIRDQSAEANLFARRTFIAFCGVVVLLLVLFSNIFDLEINSYQKYQTRSNSNRIKLLPVATNRGLIYDRNGVLLAENKPIYSLEIIPEQVKGTESDLKKRPREETTSESAQEMAASFRKVEEAAVFHSRGGS